MGIVATVIGSTFYGVKHSPQLSQLCPDLTLPVRLRKTVPDPPQGVLQNSAESTALCDYGVCMSTSADPKDGGDGTGSTWLMPTIQKAIESA